MRIDADTIIYAYLFICAALMVFNLFYIFRAKARKEKQRSRVDGWRRASGGTKMPGAAR